MLEAKLRREKLNVCTLDELMTFCDESRQRGVPLPEDIVPTLKTLHSQSGAGIMYIEKKD